MPFSSLLAHPTSQRYDTQQLRGEEWLEVNKMHLSALNTTSAGNQPFENQKFWENVIAGFSTINHAVTVRLTSHTKS